MAVIDVRERHDERRAEIGSDGKVKYHRALLVRTTDIHDGPAVALGASGVPRWRDQYSDDNDALADQIVCEPWSEGGSATGKHWKIDIDYTYLDDTTLSTHPLARPPEFSYSATNYSEPVFLDESSPRRPYVNSCGDPLETVTERNREEQVVSMVRNEETFSPIDSDHYANTSNDAIVTLDGTSYAPDTLLLGMPTATKERELFAGTEVTYYKVTRQFHTRREGWKDQILDIGYNELVQVPGPSGTLVYDRSPITDATGLRTTRPWPLDGHGHALPEPSGRPATLERRPYRSISWTSLALE